MKRILSLILAFCMITSLLPAVTFAAEPLKIYNYKISANSLTVSAKSDYGIAANKNFSNNDLAYISWKSKKDGALATLDPGLTDGFELVGRTTNDNSPQLYASGVSTQFKMSYYDYAKDAKTTYYTKTGTDGRPHFAVLLNIPRAGEYKISAVNNFSVDDAAIKGTINAYENNKDSFDQSLNDTGKMDTGIITQVYFAKAEDTYSKKGMGNVITNGIKLGMYDSRAFGEKTELGTVEVSSPGEYYLLFDTNEETFAENSAVYTRFNYNGEVLTSSNEWQIFCLSGITLTPTNIPELDSVVIEYDEESSAIKLVSAKMSDGKEADLKGADIKFSIIGSDKITIDEKTGKITRGEEAVDIIARVDVALGEKSVFSTLPITVKAIEFSGYYLKYDFAVADKTVRLDEDVTPEMTKNFWAWGASNRKIPTLNATSRYIQFGTYKNDWVALRLNVPVAGVYKTKLTYGVNASTHTGAGPGKLYVFPCDTDDIATKIANTESIGEVDFKGMGSAFEYDKEKELENVTFSAPGEYYLVFSALGYADNAHNMYPTAIEFIGGDMLSAVNIAVENDDFVIEENEEREVHINAVYLSNYSEADEYTVAYKSADERIATVDENGKICGVSQGATTVTVSVEYNGTKIEKNVDVLVLPQGSSGYNVIYDLTATDIVGTTFEDTKNFWKGTSDTGIAINVPVAGRYNVDCGDWQGSVKIEDNIIEGYYNFPSAGEYTVEFEGNGIPDRLKLYGGREIAPMSAVINVTGTIASVDEIIMSDGSRQNTVGAKIKYSIDDFSVASIDEMTGKILPSKNGGETAIRASVGIYGFTVLCSIPVTISGVDAKASEVVATYSFNTASDSWKLANYTAWDDKYGGATTWSIKEITYADTDGWAWHMSSNPSLNPYASMWTSAGGATIQPGANGWAAIKLNIPAKGRYWVTLTSSKSYDAAYGSADIFVIPLKDTVQEIESALTPENLLTTLNCRDESLDAAKAVVDELGAVYFETAGDYLMVFRDTGANKRVIPRILTLNGQNGVRYADFKISSNELEVGDKITAEVFARLLDGTQLTKDDTTFVFKSSNEEVATFIDGEVEAVGDGETTLTFTAIYGTQTATLEKNIKVKNTSEILGVEIVPKRTSDYVGKSISLSAKLIYEKGLPKRLDNTDVTYEIIEGNASIVDGVVISETEGAVVVVAKYGNYTSEPQKIEFKAGNMKDEQTYYTPERVATAKENIKKYKWAKAEFEGTLATAESYLPYVDALYSVTVGKGVPRSYKVGYRNDPDYVYCRYCGENAEEGYGGFTYNLNRLWKIQCPACKRIFPSNDFELLYSRGLVNGNYDVAVARQKNAEAVASGEKDALTNELYPELWKDPAASTYNKDPRTGDVVDGKMWGVDDGWGYHTGRTCSNGEPEVHTYVSYFAYKIPNVVAKRTQDFAEAYLYTGDAKYGRAGAILLDRVADVYPEAFTNEFFYLGFATGGGGDDRGKFTGRIGDAERTDSYALAADGLFDYLRTEDPQLINYLSQKADEYNLENKKRTWEDIWSNWADNLLWESFEAIKTCHLLGNTGYHQSAAAGLMLVLDEEPRSSEILDWLYTGAPVLGSAEMEYDNNPGGNVSHNFLNLIDRDGMGNEASPSYNLTWVFHFNDLAKYIRLYTEDSKYDLYQNPKFMQMFRAAAPIVLTKTHHPQIGDASSVATNEFLGNYQSVKEGFYYLKDTPVGSDIAEYIYLRNGDSEKGLHYDIFTKDPENMENDILSRINGTTARDSEMLAGYGFAVLREGDEYGEKSSPTYVNNMRDFWIWFGPNGKWSHSHQDALNIGIESYGINMAPDLGYSEASGQLPSRWQWVRSTISHNTVVVNEKNQIDHGLRSQFPQHFDDSGDVKLMDVDASGAYNETSIYRRTLVMINAGDDVSYGVDFFRIKGGTDHLYSFHSQSDSVYSTEGLGEIHYQTDNGKADGSFIGTYAGENVSYGPDPSNSTVESRFTYRAGYTWMKDVRRAYDVGKFTIDYNVTDFRKLLKDSRDLHMRVTMLNDFRLSEVAMTKGHVPPKIENKPIPEQLEYMLARRTSENGESLDSLYTTVYEPYKGERYLKNMESVSVTTDEMAGTDDVAKAIKVIRKNADGTDGRVDYIVYATNNDVIYTVTDGNFSFDFRGFVGVYSINEDGVCIYSYVHDGDIIGERESVSKAKQYTGRVEKFTDMLTTENYIWIEPDGEAETSSFVGKYMFIDNDRVDNGVYKIVSAEPDSGLLKLGIGMTSVLRNYRDDTDVSLGYVYNIAKGQTATIPITNTVEFKPVFDEVKSTSVSAGNSLKINVSATTANGGLNYIGTNIPRGASVNSQTGEFAWKPDSSQVGENHVAITARDEYGRESTLHFTVTVYGSTAEKPSDGNATEKTPTEGSAGGGGAEPTDKPDDGTNKSDNKDTESLPLEEKVPSAGEADEVEKPKFTDLGNHIWAEDSINTLAADGIIKGTSASAFSPANNITRADFALLLVRAFGLESEDTENFADVSASDYFAPELAIARNTGIVNGIGDNKYAPKNTITRQDMMVIVYRALQKLNVGFGIYDEPQYKDFTSVAEYAKPAVSTLIGAGLVNGKSGLIAPTDYTTRAEVAVLIRRILNYTK